MICHGGDRLEIADSILVNLLSTVTYKNEFRFNSRHTSVNFILEKER